MYFFPIFHRARVARSVYFPALLLVGSSLGAESVEPAHQLPALLVTGFRQASSGEELPVPVSILTAEDISRSASATLGETLEGQPGLSSSQFGAGSSRPIIRGLGGDRVRILEGGLDSFDISQTSPDHAVGIDPALASQVEVLRGPATLIYGGAAIGGVVNARPDEIPELEVGARDTYVTLSGSPSRSALAAGRATFGLGATRVRLQGAYRDQEDYRLPGSYHPMHEEEDHEDHEHEHAPAGGSRLPNSFADSRNVSAGWITPLRGAEVGGGLSFYSSQYGVPGHEHEDEDEDHAHEEEGVQVYLERWRGNVIGHLHEPLPYIHTLSLQVASGDYWHEEREDGEALTRFERKGWEARTDVFHEPLGHLSGVFGLHLSRSRLTSVGEEALSPPSTTRNQAAYMIEEWNQGRWQLQSGVRLERQTVNVEGVSDRYSKVIASGSSGVSWSVSEVWAVGLVLSSSQRHPSANELFANGPHAATRRFEVGDPGLKPEHSNGVDLVVRRVSGPVTGSVSVFYSRYNDFIYLQDSGVTQAGFEVARQVQADARFYGGELELTWQALHGEGWQVNVLAFADSVRATLVDDGAPLPRIPPVRIGGGIELEAPWLVVELSARHALRQTRVQSGEAQTPSHTLLNLYAAHILHEGPRRWEAFFKIRNLTDEVAFLHTSYLKEEAPVPGRTFEAGLRVDF